MRVLHLLSSSAFHGAEAMAAELVRQLHALGAKVDVAVLDNAGRGNAEIFDAVGAAAQGTHRIACGGALDPATVIGLRRLLADRHIDVVHSHKYKTTFYALLARRHAATRLLTTYHNWTYQTRALRMYAALDKRMARFNDLCVGVSGQVCAELARFVPAERVRRIDNGVDTEVYRPVAMRAHAKAALGLRGDRQVLGFVGRLSPEKGLDYLIEALADLPREDFDTLIVGDGELRPHLEQRIRDSGLAQRVHLLGNRRDMPAVYAAIDTLVLPSTVEAFPMVLLEGMAAGCAVVASRVGDVERIVRPDANGWIVPPGNVVALRSALAEALAGPERVTRYGAEGQRQVGAKFTSRRMAMAYLKSYDSAPKIDGRPWTGGTAI